MSHEISENAIGLAGVESGKRQAEFPSTESPKVPFFEVKTDVEKCRCQGSVCVYSNCSVFCSIVIPDAVHLSCPYKIKDLEYSVTRLWASGPSSEIYSFL